MEVKGEISIEHTVWCGICMNWEQAAEPTKRLMGIFARSRGWKYTKEKGWVCPKCAEVK